MPLTPERRVHVRIRLARHEHDESGIGVRQAAAERLLASGADNAEPVEHWAETKRALADELEAKHR